jgi:bifunctional UDP-N-acetylglucosamine pyrophosphorylase/glucosamine-1-phosphate N-acetyltransferase
LSYVGDASIGAKTNVGAGTITCNYDGGAKYRTEIGENVFIGSTSTLVAPIKIGAGAYIGSGSVITQDVAPDAMALGRARQVEKPSRGKQCRQAYEKEPGSLLNEPNLANPSAGNNKKDGV